MRFLIAALSAVAITLSLFWGMSALVQPDTVPGTTASGAEMVSFIRVKQESRTETKQRVKPEPEQPQEQPPAPPMPALQSEAVDAPDIEPMSFDAPALDMGLQLNTSPTLGDAVMAPAQIAQDAPLIPLVRVPPRYPRRAAMRRIEGWVKVEFTIGKSGHVKPGSARVIEADPEGLFDRAALRAIYKWRFKPHTVAGKPRQREAVQTLEFKL